MERQTSWLSYYEVLIDRKDSQKVMCDYWNTEKYRNKNQLQFSCANSTQLNVQKKFIEIPYVTITMQGITKKPNYTGSSKEIEKCSRSFQNVFASNLLPSRDVAQEQNPLRLAHPIVSSSLTICKHTVSLRQSCTRCVATQLPK